MAQTTLIKMGVVNKSPVFRGSKGERRGARARGNTHMPDTMTGQGFRITAAQRRLKELTDMRLSSIKNATQYK